MFGVIDHVGRARRAGATAPRAGGSSSTAPSAGTTPAASPTCSTSRPDLIEKDPHEPRPRRPLHRRRVDRAGLRRAAGGDLPAQRGGGRHGARRAPRPTSTPRSPPRARPSTRGRGRARRRGSGSRSCEAFSGLYAARMGEMADLITTEMGSPDLVLQPGPVAGAVDADRGVPRGGPRVPVGGAPSRSARRRRDRPARAGGRGGRDPAVERPAVHDHVQAGPCPARGLHGRGQAGAGDAARPLPAGRAAPGGRRTPRRRQHRGRRPRGGRAPGRPPRRRQGGLHRLDGRGADDRGRVRRAAQAGQPRARRQVGRDRARRRRPGRDDGGPEVRRSDELRPGLRGPDPDPGQPEQLRRGGRRARRDRVVDAGRRPHRPRDRDRPDGRAAPAGAGGEVHRARPGGGRPGRGRRQRDARGPRPRLVRAPDGLRRRRQPDADRAGGDLRPGALGDPVRRRRRRRTDRQRLRLRPGRHRVDRRPGCRASTSPAGCAPAPTA